MAGNTDKKLCIIGAGASGLVAARHAQERGFSVTIIEKESKLGGVFRYNVYEEAQQVSSKYLTCFSDFRVADADIRPCSDHLSMPEYIAYLEKYCDAFNIRKSIEFDTKVVHVSRGSHGGYGVTTLRKRKKTDSKSRGKKHNASADKQTRSFDLVVVASGLHSYPIEWSVPGLESFTGEVMHSSQYKSKEQIRGKKVLVVGCGETAHDVCYQALSVDCPQITMSHKNGFLAVPKELPGGVPLDIFITNVFESGYEHRWMDEHKIKWRVASFFIRLMFFIATGSTIGYDQWVAGKKDVKRGWHFIMKTPAAMPYINRKHKPFWRSLPWKWLDKPLQYDGEIAVASLVQSYDSNTKSFVCRDGQRVQADVVVVANGFKQLFPFLEAPEGGEPLVNTCPESGSHLLPTDRHVTELNDPSLAFIGFVRPNVGAIPPLAELQAMWWLEAVEGNLKAQTLKKATYGLLSQTSSKAMTYGVDHGSYSHHLADDIGAVPSLLPPELSVNGLNAWLLVTHPRALIAYALGQAFPSFFRMEGSFKSDKCIRIAETELWETITRRGFGANVMFLGITVIFGYINFLCWVCDKCLSLANATHKQKAL